MRICVVKSRFLLYKNDFKIQIGFKVVVKKGTNKIKSILQTIDFEHDTINFKIKKWILLTLFDYQYQLKNINFIYIFFYYWEYNQILKWNDLYKDKSA